MKWFIIILVIGGISFAGWHFKDEIIDAVQSFSKDGDGDGGGGGDPKNGGPEGSGGNGGGTNNGGNDNANQPDPIDLQYPMPEFQPIDELVDNWQNVPATAFPREVNLKADVKFELAGGAGYTTVKAGKPALALALTNGQLVLAPRAGATIRATAPIDDTDFKDVLGAAYEAYKDRKRQDVEKQRDRARNLAAITPKQPAGTASTTIDIVPDENLLNEYEAKLGAMPKRAANGTVPVMVASIQNGDVSEIKLDEITSWGPVRYEIVQGQPYWTGTVNYKTTSLFGTFPTEAMALMRHGKVDTWVYTGSMEIVP